MINGKKIVQMDKGSPDFDSIVNIGNETGIIDANHIFRGLLHTSPEGEITKTFPSAAELIKACPVIPIAGYSKSFSIRNDGRSAITIAPGEGGSINGSDTISASSYAAHYKIRFTSVTSGVESYQIIRN